MVNRRRRGGGRKTNPLTRAPARLRVPKVTFDGTTITATAVGNPLTAISNVIGSYAEFNCSSGGVGGQLVAFTQLYSEYRFKWVKAHWIPAVSPGVAAGGSSCYIVPDTNAEHMNIMRTATQTDVMGYARQARGTKMFNAWERFTYNIPMFYRRKWFDVDADTPTTIEELNRATQAFLLIGAETIGATDTIGKFQFEFAVEVRGLIGVPT